MTLLSNTKSSIGREGMPGQGPFMVVIIKALGDRILEAKFTTYGCPAAIACGQFVMEWVEGKTLKEAVQINEAFVVDSIGHMPIGREHCPGLAIKALHNAINEL